MYPKNSSRAASMKRCIEDKHIVENKNDEEETIEKPRPSEGCKWDKTDSDCEFICDKNYNIKSITIMWWAWHWSF